ncbi:MAG TPA: cytochrome c, partial [Usitatibacteraceae bacterium]|nr:cytochrome c [Usitatibacteraceae bacterium]
GRKVYNFRCYYCHGYSGDAKTVASAVLIPPPRDFQSTPAATLPVTRIEQVVRQGVPGTAMAAFRDVISEREIQAVARFVRSEFLERRARNTRYHTAENGWPDHDRRHADALPFARGEIALSVPPEQLPAHQRRGRQTYVTHCITCHDRGSGNADGPVWSRKP